MLKTKWQIRAYYLDACNCEGVSGIQIIKGNYGSVKLDKLNMVLIGS